MQKKIKTLLIILPVYIILYTLYWPSGVSAATIAKPVHNFGLVGYWAMEEGKGNSITYDRSGKGNNGTLTSMDPATDWVNSKSGLGTALDFDGSNDYINAGSDSSLDNLITYSVSAWIKPDSLGEGSFGRIVDKDQNALTGWLFYLCNSASAPTCSSALRFSPSFSGTDGAWSTGTDTIVLGAWHHVVVTYNSSSTGNDPIFYINGVVSPIATETNPTGSVSSDSSNLFTIGNRTAGDRTFDGIIDEVRVYNRILSAQDVDRLYRSGVQKPQVSAGVSNTGLMGHWKFDDGVGTRAEDSSGRKATGTLVNTPTWVTGRLGKALSFDAASSEYISMPNNGYSSLTSGSITAWIFPQQGGVIISTFTNSSNNRQFPFEIANSNGRFKLGATAVNSSGTVIFLCRTDTEFPYDNWYFVTYTTANGSGTFDLYVNGVNYAYTCTTGAPTDFFYGDAMSGSDILQIGAKSDISNLHASYIQAVIDEVRIYNRVLPASEVNKLYEESKATVVNKTNTDRLRNGLVGHWTFDGKNTYQDKVFDLSGNNNTGTLTGGALPVAGKTGQAIQFDGTSDYINMGDVDILNGATAATISFWAMLDSLGTGERFVAKWGTAAGSRAYVVSLDDTNSDEIIFGFAEGTDMDVFSTTDANLSPKIWYHIAVTWTDSTRNVYINGIPKSITLTLDNGVASLQNTANALYVGYDTDAGSNFINGKIDDIRIYNRVLSIDEIRGLYNMGL